MEWIEALKKQLDDWYGHYAEYDPVFTWWTEQPKQEADLALTTYTDFLAEGVFGADLSLDWTSADWDFAGSYDDQIWSPELSLFYGLNRTCDLRFTAKVLPLDDGSVVLRRHALVTEATAQPPLQERTHRLPQRGLVRAGLALAKMYLFLDAARRAGPDEQAGWADAARRSFHAFRSHWRGDRP